MTHSPPLMRRFSIRLRMHGAIAMVLGLFALVGAIGLLGGRHLAELNTDRLALTLENHTIRGGLFETVASAAVLAGVAKRVIPVALPDALVVVHAAFHGELLAPVKVSVYHGVIAPPPAVVTASGAVAVLLPAASYAVTVYEYDVLAVRPLSSNARAVMRPEMSTPPRFTR